MQKPSKPMADFPLFAHSNGQWAKKIKGKLYYFGKWDEPTLALNRYLSEKSSITSTGQQPKKIVLKGLIWKDLANLFMTDVRRRLDQGEIREITHENYRHFFRRVFRHIDKTSDFHATDWSKLGTDFRVGVAAKPRELTSSGWRTEVNTLHVVLKWAIQQNLISEKPALGDEWKRATRKQIRKAKTNQKRSFSPQEIRSMLDHCAKSSKQALRAMILLGVNAGMGNHDCASLEARFVDFETGWCVFDRPKTGVDRKCRLWPETLEALKAYLEVRPKSDLPFIFVTARGNQWSREGKNECAITKEFLKVMRASGCYIAGRGFYGLRRSCATAGAEARDQGAVNKIMGHSESSISSLYVDYISEKRLFRVSKIVRKWVFGKKPTR